LQVITIKDEPMDFDYEDNVEIISETTNNLEQPVSINFLFSRTNYDKKNFSI